MCNRGSIGRRATTSVELIHGMPGVQALLSSFCKNGLEVLFSEVLFSEVLRPKYFSPKYFFQSTFFAKKQMKKVIAGIASSFEEEGVMKI
jgi:hypothetical protein